MILPWSFFLPLMLTKLRVMTRVKVLKTQEIITAAATRTALFCASGLYCAREGRKTPHLSPIYAIVE